MTREGSAEQLSAIFELRAIPDYFPHNEIGRIARALAKYVAGMNKGKDVKFKKSRSGAASSLTRSGDGAAVPWTKQTLTSIRTVVVRAQRRGQDTLET